jgi:outer membrane protein
MSSRRGRRQAPRGRTLPRLWLVGVGLCLVGRTAAAQPAATVGATPQAATRITLADAVRIALRQNYTLALARNATALDAESVRLEREAFLPSVSASASGAQNYGRTFNQTVGVITGAGSQSVSATATASTTIFNGLQNVANLRQAVYTHDASGQDLARARQTAIFTVTSDYLALVTDQEQLRIQQDNLASQQAQEEQIDKLVAAGARAISDQYSQEATVASAQSSVVSAQNTLELARVDLIQVLQLDPRGTYEFVTPVVTDSSAVRQRDALDTLLTRAFAQRADLASAALAVRAAEQGVRSAAGEWWPTLTASASFGSSYQSGTGGGFASQFTNQQGGSVSLGLSLPIFDQGAASVATQKARIARDNATLALANERQTVAVDVRRAYLNLIADRETLAASLAQLRASDLAVVTTRQRYQVGAATLLELTEAQATQRQAASAVVTARYDLVFHQSLMAYYTGDSAFESVTPAS